MFQVKSSRGTVLVWRQSDAPAAPPPGTLGERRQFILITGSGLTRTYSRSQLFHTGNSMSHTGSGGISLSGAASSAMSVAASGSGGISLSGAAGVVMSMFHTAAGGISFAGEAIASFVQTTYNHVASGGMSFSGAATVSFVGGASSGKRFWPRSLMPFGRMGMR